MRVINPWSLIFFPDDNFRANSGGPYPVVDFEDRTVVSAAAN
jgi:hypothetical protein